jgi:hypothetical protein
MIKKIGILLLAFIAVVGLSSAVSAAPIVGPNYGPTYGHYGSYGGHNTNIIIINRHRHHFFPPFYRFHRHHFFPPWWFMHRHHYFPRFYGR